MTRLSFLQLHAEYSHDNDIYLVHRVTQAWQLSQYVNLTSGDADLSIVAGDFNAAPDDISSQIVRHNSSLYDSYEERENKVICPPPTPDPRFLEGPEQHFECNPGGWLIFVVSPFPECIGRLQRCDMCPSTELLQD